MKKDYKFLAIPLVLIAFLPLVYQFGFTTSPKSTHELFAEHFSPQRLLDDTQWRSERFSSLDPTEEERQKVKAQLAYREAIKAYQDNDFERAVVQFETHQALSEKSEPNLPLYLGIAYLATEQLDKAETTLESALNQVSNAKKGDAEWYLVLTLIRKNALDQAEQYLKALIARAPDHPRYNQAVQLQQQIQQRSAS